MQIVMVEIKNKKYYIKLRKYQSLGLGKFKIKNKTFWWTKSALAQNPPSLINVEYVFLLYPPGQLLTQGLQSHVVSLGEEEEEQYCPLW